MPSKWPMTSLAEVCDEVRYGFTAKAVDSDTGVRFLRGTDISGRDHIDWNTVPYCEISEDDEQKYRLMDGDIVIVRMGTIGETALVANPPRSVCASYLIRHRIDRTAALPAFVYYVLRSHLFSAFISSHGGGSVQPNINAKVLGGFTFPLPPLTIQRRIAAILGSLDDKIELNRRMNRTLERMAQALFKSWFIDFDPVRAKAEGDPTAGGLPPHLAALFPDAFQDSPLGPIPEGWEVQSLDEIAEYLNGLACQKYPAVEGKASLPVIKIRELRQGITENSDRATAEVAAKYIINDGDILFSWSGSLLVTIWCNGRGVLNQHVFKVTSAKYPKWYYYHATKHHLEEFQRIAVDKATTMGHIQRHHLTNAKLAVPPEKLMLAATEILGTAIDRRINAQRQARTLARLRDTLLPKLLSGEIEVPEA